MTVDTGLGLNAASAVVRAAGEGGQGIISTCRWLTLAALFLLTSFPEVAFGQSHLACNIGAYRLSDGRVLVLSPGDGGNLRYTIDTGRAGKLFPVDDAGFEGGAGWRNRTPVTVRAQISGCDEIRWQDAATQATIGRRIAPNIVRMNILHADIELYGELHLPPTGQPETILVLQYGSGRESAVEHQVLQHLLPHHGVAVVVFDKRGTGRSTGNYSADAGALAADLAAVVAHLRRLPAARNVAIGLMGESQGGWVVPLAAEAVTPDYLIVSYGLAISMLEENRQEVMGVLAAQGFDPAIRDVAEEVIVVTNRIMLSRFAEGLPELEALRRQHGQEAWYRALGGDFTGPIANATPAEMETVRAAFDFPYDLTYNPRDTLERLRTPSLWMLAAKDTEAPSETTFAVLEDARASGSPIDIAIFPNADHGIIEVAGGTSAADRTLQGTHSPGYFELLIDWAKYRRFRSGYGSAILRPHDRD